MFFCKVQVASMQATQKSPFKITVNLLLWQLPNEFWKFCLHLATFVSEVVYNSFSGQISWLHIMVFILSNQLSWFADLVKLYYKPVGCGFVLQTTIKCLLGSGELYTQIHFKPYSNLLLESSKTCFGTQNQSNCSIYNPNFYWKNKKFEEISGIPFWCCMCILIHKKLCYMYVITDSIYIINHHVTLFVIRKQGIMKVNCSQCENMNMSMSKINITP